MKDIPVKIQLDTITFQLKKHHNFDWLTKLGGGQDRSFMKWEASEGLYEVAYRAVNENRSERYASMEEFNNAWLKAYNTENL